MNQRQPGANSGISPVWKALATETRNPKSGLRFPEGGADRLCSGTDYLDKTLKVEDRLSRLHPVQWLLYLTAPASPLGPFFAPTPSSHSARPAIDNAPI